MKSKPRRPMMLPRFRRSLINPILDFIDRVTDPDSMIPPRSFRHGFNVDFEQTGKSLKDLLIEYGGLQPDHRVLDIGSGAGRVAIPLTRYLSSEGEYWGLDIEKNCIRWCQDRITPKFNNFHFQHGDITNKQFNRKGAIRARDYKFPFDDSTFDLVFLISVFSHMLPKDLENYLSEISRLLNQGGKCLFTVFLVNGYKEVPNRSHFRVLDFKYEGENYRTSNKVNPENAIAIKEDYLYEQLNENGLKVSHHKKPRSWLQGPFFEEEQDLFVVTKRDDV